MGTEFETKEWKKYISDNELPWINVSDNPKYPNAFRDIYDIFSTPVLYVLDEDGIIKAKKIDIEQINDLLDQFEKQEKGREQQENE